MTETYSGGRQSKKMSKRQRKQYLRHLSRSFKHADRIKKKLDDQKEKEVLVADLTLEKDLDTLLS